MTNAIILARLDLEGLPEGVILDRQAEPSEAEGRAFAGWTTPLSPHRYWKRPSQFRIVHEPPGPAIDHPKHHDDCLLAGDFLWGDYTVEAAVLQLDPGAPLTHDEPDAQWGRTGLVARYQNLRHYYFLCIEARERLRLYRRADDDWHVLAERPLPTPQDDYVRLRMAVKADRITCWANDEALFEAADAAFPTGKAGVRTNTASRLREVHVTSTPAADAAFVQARSRRERDLDAAREQHPNAVLWKRVDKSCFPGSGCVPARVPSPDRWGFVLFSPNATWAEGAQEALGLKAIDLDGRLLWENPVRGVRYPRVADMDGDGVDDVVCFLERTFAVIDGRTGQVVHEAPLPVQVTEDGTRRTLAPEFGGVYLADLHGAGAPRDVILKEENHRGGHQLWAYDSALRSLWSVTIPYPRYGHGIHVFDVDGDGRDEIAAGFSIIGPEGDILWRVVGGDSIPAFGSDHIDTCAMGPFGPNGEVRLAACTGTDGFWLIDGATHEPIVKHRMGHAQGLAVGNFDPDRPGLDMIVGTRWDNYGIVSFIDGQGDRYFTFEPDNVSQGGTPVNWTGTGQELSFLHSTEEALGLYDCRGRQVVVMPPELTERSFYGKVGRLPCHVDLCRDPRQELVFNLEDEILIFTQDNDLPAGQRVYAPKLRTENRIPVVSIPAWATA